MILGNKLLLGYLSVYASESRKVPHTLCFGNPSPNGSRSTHVKLFVFRRNSPRTNHHMVSLLLLEKDHSRKDSRVKRFGNDFHAGMTVAATWRYLSSPGTHTGQITALL